MFTKEQIARAALEAGVGVEKIKQMLKLLGDTSALRSNECADRNGKYDSCEHGWRHEKYLPWGLFRTLLGMKEKKCEICGHERRMYDVGLYG